MTMPVETIQVEHALGSYPILIGSDLLGDKVLFEQYVPARDVLLVSNTTVAPLYGSRVADALRPRRVVDVSLPDGEVHKTLPNVARIIDVLVANGFARDCAV